MREPYPRGHFYSALPDIEWVEENKESIYNYHTDIKSSINMQDDAQLQLIEKLSSFYADFPYTEKRDSKFRFSFQQNFFFHSDALMLFLMLRHFCPSRVIEIGSGHSSALMLDTNEYFLGNKAMFTFVEPYPERLYSTLRDTDKDRTNIITDMVQEVSLDTFRTLGEDDFLFIDSSHVSRAGSDVNYLLFEVLPELKPGVIVHFHDIFWPFEYPLDWVQQGWAWNEAYTLRAFLQYNKQFSVLMFNSYAARRFQNHLKKTMPLFLSKVGELDDFGGTSLWLRKN